MKNKSLKKILVLEKISLILFIIFMFFPLTIGLLPPLTFLILHSYFPSTEILFTNWLNTHFDGLETIFGWIWGGLFLSAIIAGSIAQHLKHTNRNDNSS